MLMLEVLLPRGTFGLAPPGSLTAAAAEVSAGVHAACRSGVLPAAIAGSQRANLPGDDDMDPAQQRGGARGAGLLAGQPVNLARRQVRELGRHDGVVRQRRPHRPPRSHPQRTALCRHPTRARSARVAR